MDEKYLVDFCLPGFDFPKKVNRVLYSIDQQNWYPRQVFLGNEKAESWVTGLWQRFLFYDGTLSIIFPVPPEEQILRSELCADIFGGGGWN